MTTVYDRVKSIVVDKLGVEEDEVTETASFIENLNADSLDLVELIMRSKRNSPRAKDSWRYLMRTLLISRPSVPL